MSVQTGHPFGAVRPAATAALVAAAGTLTWVAGGPWLPGGRWLAVHLFTLGVLTNLVLAFTEHFGRTLTRMPAATTTWQVAVVNGGIVTTLVGVVGGHRWATALGSTIVTAVVTVAYVRLRRFRKDAVGARFGWVVRCYERAHGAFIHGAVLGVLLGTGVLRGGWYGSGRLAHLHVNVLGWGGVTLLATLVFFGPTVARTRIAAGADEQAATAIRRGMTALTVAVLSLLGSGAGGSVGTGMRLLAAVAMAGFAASVVVTCRPVARAALTSRATAGRWAIAAVAVWFPVVVTADVLVLATARWRWLDAVGLAMFLGVLAQAVMATLVHVAPLVLTGRGDHRSLLRARLERGLTTRTLVFNAGVVAVTVAAAIRGTAGGVLARVGWGLVLATVVWVVAGALGTRFQLGRGAADPGPG